MSFSDIFNTVTGYFTSAQQNTDQATSLKVFTDYLNNLTVNGTIRLWVAGSQGYGLPSSTVNLMYQIANTTANKGFNYKGTIEIYYTDDGLEPVLPKIYELIPELGGKTTGTVAGATIKVILWTAVPADAVSLAFTGGYDETDNLAEKLNATYFLMLQPYLADDSEEIQFKDTAQTSINLCDQSLLEKGAFKQRAYWQQVPVPVPTTAEWAYYSSIDAATANQMAVLQNVIASLTTYGFDMGVAYSILTEGSYLLQKPAEDRLFEVIAGYLASQTNGSGGVRTGAKPIIILVMDDFTNSSANGNPTVSDLVDGGYNTSENINNSLLTDDTVLLDQSEKESLQQSLKPHTYRQNYLTAVAASTRTHYQWEPTTANLPAEYTWLNDKSNNKVLLVNVGRVAQPIFEYLMNLSTMPAIFEGQDIGNLALQFGKPYFQVATPNSTAIQYPTTLLGYSDADTEEEDGVSYAPVVYVPSIVYKMQKVANMINFQLQYWPSNVSNNPAEIIGTFIRNYKSSATGDYQTYYKSVAAFYQDISNDKFRIAAAYLGYTITSMESPAADPLGDLLAKLYKNLHGGVLDLFPEVYNSGSIFKFISGLVGATFKLTEATVTPAEGTTTPDEIVVTGNSSALDNVPLAFVITFTAPEGSIVSEWKMTYTGDWLTSELPWLQFNQPYVLFTVADTLVPVQGGVGGLLEGLDKLDISIRLPIETGVWQLEGHFGAPASVSQFYQLAGGVNLVQSLPSPLNAFADIGVTDFQLAYNSNNTTIEYISFVMATGEPVTLMTGLELENIGLNVLIQNPGSVANRTTTWSVTGTFKIGTTADAGVILTSMNYPDPIFSGQLMDGVIRVTDVFNLFLPGTVFDPQGYSPEITEFIATFVNATGDYSVTSKLNFDWSFQILPAAPQITINAVSVNVESTGGKLKGGLSGGFTFGTGDAAFTITISANYDSTDGWVFSGLQTADSTLFLSNLVKQLLPSEWDVLSADDYGLNNLGFNFAETTKYYDVSGETDGYWTVPFIDLQVRADLKFGYGIFKEDSGDSTNIGYYCKLNADIEWIGIKMNLFYDYNPDVQTFGFTWGVLTGTITEQAVEGDTKKHWIGTLKFTDSVTLGSIIEDAISWLSGYKYGLGSPWNLLNSLSLSALELVYDFTAQTVSFNLDIGKIDLGFCTINSIGINYASHSPKEEGDGVFITIDGSFFWLTGSNEPGLSANQLKWDASKPETTPAPSGQGNKYFDLRLLALGQHVTLPAFANATSVQAAIDAMAQLPATEAGAIPAITFDPNSNWLVGMNFGVLKLGDDSSSSSSNKDSSSGDDADSGYFIDMQIVFNDPNLYALRIALSGAPARIFKGLDFQILYRKISDSVGVYQAEITLPDIMRKIQLGEVNITLPTFAIEIYTNGDFLVDLGFPKDSDFSRSFTLQMIIFVPFPVPIMGSAGLYFGKLSSATSTQVPVIDNGTFNPVLVFGIGIQFGLGYDFNAGILAAGFSLTFVTIIEGVLAKFNPYTEQNTSNGSQADIAPAYYYSIKGIVGIQGKLYGYVDFKIIKAEVNVLLSVMADITITAYAPIILGLTARVSVSVSVKINLGFFTIKISFSFDMTIRESYEIKVGGGSPPWHVSSSSAPQQNVMLKSTANTMPAATLNTNRMRSFTFLLTVQDNFVDTPVWTNLTTPATKASLIAYLGFGLSMAGDLATTPAQQQAVYTAMLFIESVAATSDTSSTTTTTTDTSFETLSKQVFRWVLAAFHNGSIAQGDLDKLPITQVRLQEIYDYLNNDDNTDPIPVSDIEAFLAAQTFMTVSHPTDNTGSTDAAYFPIAPKLSITTPASAQQKTLTYSFDAYNTLSTSYINDLREYFDELAIQMNAAAESDEMTLAVAAPQNNPESMATFIFSDYFLLIARQMIHNAQDALSAFQYTIVTGQTSNEVVTWIDTFGQFDGGYTYTISELFTDNKAHLLTVGKPLQVSQSSYSTVSQDTFTTVSQKSIYSNSFTATDLATYNADNTLILQSGLSVTYTGKDSIVVQAGNTLNSIAAGYSVSLGELLANSDVLTLVGLLMPSSKLLLPDFTSQTQDADTLTSFAARFGVSIDALAQVAGNGTITDLFDITDNDGRLTMTDLPQFAIGELIEEIQATSGLQQLSGMASRYYLTGLRVPTTGITPNFQGMWINDAMQFEQTTAGIFSLTGQQFPLPVLTSGTSFDISLNIPATLTWMTFDGGKSSMDINVAQSSTSYTQIDVVRQYAQQNYLDLAITQLGLGDMFSSSYGHYSFSTVSSWQAGSNILLPYGGTTGEAQTLNIWTLPSDLINLADPAGRNTTPRFQVQLGTVDPVTKAIKSQPISDYGWGTQVTFNIKKVPLSADSATSATTYEISGADGNNALILEKMVTYLNNNDALIDQIIFGYAPNQSNGSNPGVQTDPIADLTIGIAQANLSTFTKPPTAFTFAAFATEAVTVVKDTSNLLNDPTELIRLLWQASITRDGGYYLYYFNMENGEGLPDHVFNDKGEASLTLIVIYTASTVVEYQDLLQPYMNMFVTATPVNASDSSLYAQAAPITQQATFSTGDVLSNIAYQYFTNVGDAVEDNPTAVLTTGVSIAVPEGTYQVQTAAGETLQSVADKFNTTPAAIQAANPVVTSWPAVLPMYMGLRLPSLTVAAGSNANTKTLQAIALYYGMDLTALANYNSNTVNLFTNGTVLNMSGGPITRVATVPAGVVSLEAIRTEPADIPANPTDAGYALTFLQQNFSILTFQLMANGWFTSSNPSLPVGPTDEVSDPNNTYDNGQDLTGKWIFKQSVPYYKFAAQPAMLKTTGLPDISTSPYKGIGYLVQPDFIWLDIYGNSILNTLSQPSSGNVMNESPILTGYTDALLGVSQWPSVSAEWLVNKDATSGNVTIDIPLSFDTTRYNGMLSAYATSSTTLLLTFTEDLDATSANTIANYTITPTVAVTAAVWQSANPKTVILTVDEMAAELEYTLAIGNIKGSVTNVVFNGQATYSFIPQDTGTFPADPSATSSVTQQATSDFQVYTQLWYQLTDPNGMAVSMETTMYDAQTNATFVLDTAAYANLVSWVSTIYLYLQDRSVGGTTVTAPALVFNLPFAIDPTKIITDQIFELTLSLSIQRTGGAIMGDFETTGSVKEVTTLLSASSTSGTTSTKALDSFAESFENAMSIANQYNLKISTGADRDKLGQQKPDGTIWAVRLGVDDVQPISYEVVTPGAPALFAPRPVSNTLESRSDVPIYDYNTGSGINFTTPSSYKSFTEIDLDMWVGTFFSAMDTILTPEFTASIQLVDTKLSMSYLQSIQDSKESLADIAKLLMVTVFTDEVDNPMALTAVQEALKQSLLVRLMNLYSTNSGISFDVNVHADATTDTPPNLFGNFMQNTIFEGAVSQQTTLKTVTLYFSAALDKASAETIANYTLDDPLKVLSATLSEDTQSVVLTVSANVTLTVTKVTIGANLLDANNRHIQGTMMYTVETNYVSYVKTDQLTISAAKISLNESTPQSLAFLLSTPEIVRDVNGDVLSKIDLNLSYKATDIEHQIAEPINGFTPSSWLSFVLPNDKVASLESQLGGFSVPMFLRAFPQNPSLVNQTGVAPNISNPNISLLLEWQYIFDYSLPFHYPQDTLYFTVDFNVGQSPMARLMAIPDAFNQLAEFISVYPSIETDLKNIVTKIDANAFYATGPDAKKLFTNANYALQSFTEVVNNIVSAASSGGSGLTMMKAPKAYGSSTEAGPYSFEIQEGPVNLNGESIQVVSVTGTPPEGVGIAQVLIDPDNYTMTVWDVTSEPCTGDICYYYVDKDGQPLLSETAQSIQPRQVILPELNVLQRQDAMTTVYTTRNENLITEKTTNPEFVYTTGELAFSNAYLPTIYSEKSIEIACLPANMNQPTTRTLLAQLQVLMDTLLMENTEPTLSFQMTCNYEYKINANLNPVSLPVLMQTMVSLTLATELTPMLQNWSDAINNWIKSYNPNTFNGVLKFDLVIFSNLTKQPFPLLRLSALQLSLIYISPSYTIT